MCASAESIYGRTSADDIHVMSCDLRGEFRRARFAAGSIFLFRLGCMFCEYFFFGRGGGETRTKRGGIR